MKYQELVSSNIGRNVTVKGVRHTVSKIGKATGKLRNGDNVPYIILTSASGDEVSLHPRKAQELFTKGAVDGIAMLVDAVASKEAADAFFNDPAYNASKVEATTTLDVESVAKKVSKKARAIEIFNEAVKLKETRQYVIKRWMTELDMSLNCCNTYFQGIKSGNYK